MKTLKSSPILCSKTRTGKDKYWQCHILTNDDIFYTNTSYWQVNKNEEKSLVQFSEPYECVPTNLGRTNERNSEQQAEFEFDSIIQKQRDKGYSEVGTKADILPLPMLANKIADKGHMIQWPAYVQQKYNGQRMLFNGGEGWTRGGKDIIPEVIQHLTFDCPDAILDGELLLPGNVLLQTTLTATKKYRPELSPTLLYIVYDLIDTDMVFSERYKKLQELAVLFPKNIILAPTHKVHDMGEVMTYHREYTKNGFEETIIRSDLGGYEVAHRSSQLLKLKDMMDDEFLIKDIIAGEGSFKQCGIFVCETEKGEVFNCTPEGTMEHRKQLLQERNELIGKYLTVRYQGKTKLGIPFFPIGTSVRELEDFK